MSHETLPLRNDRLIEFWVSYRSSLLSSSPKVGESSIALRSRRSGFIFQRLEGERRRRQVIKFSLCLLLAMVEARMGERLVERGGDWLSAGGEMELCSLNMDVIFRAEQKERRGTSASGRRRIWDAERIGDRGKEDREGRRGCCWISVLRPLSANQAPLWRSGDPELK